MELLLGTESDHGLIKHGQVQHIGSLPMSRVVPVALIRLHPALKEHLSLLRVLVPNIVHLLKLKHLLLLDSHFIKFMAISHHGVLLLLLQTRLKRFVVRLVAPEEETHLGLIEVFVGSLLN